MSKQHSWPAKQAEAARNNFRLNQESTRLPETLRCSKPRNYARRLCPLNHCFKEVKRLGNHLRQYHKLSNEKARKYIKKSFLALPEDVRSESDSVSSETDSEEEESHLLQQHFSREIHMPKGDTFNYDSGDEDDHDWLGEEFFLSHARKSEKNEIYHCESKETDNVHRKMYAMNEDESSFEEIQSEEESECESEDVDNEDHEEFFFMSSSKEDELLDEFVSWLQSPDGGKKPERTAMKHKAVVMQIVRHEDSQNVNYKNLYDRAFLNNWMVKYQEEGRQAGTIKTYLGSVLHLLNFLIITEKTIFEFDKIKKIQVILQQWRRNLWKDIQKRKHEKMLIDIARFPKAEEIIVMDKSERTKGAISTLKRHMCTSPKITRSSFCSVRDYLLMYLIFDNASRPGAISNMTLKEFRDAITQNDGYVIRVLNHKTAHKGPANISMSQELFDNVYNYIKFMRNKLPGIRFEDKDTVFVSWSGNKMESNMITMQMNSYWSRIHDKTDRINPTIVRKFTTTTVHKNKPELKQDTAHLLCHGIRTAENHYALIEKQDKASCTSKELRMAQREPAKKVLTSQLIVKEFQDEILKSSISLTDVRQKISEVDCFVGIRGDVKEEKRILDLVRYRIKINDDRNTPQQCKNVSNVESSTCTRTRRFEEEKSKVRTSDHLEESADLANGGQENEDAYLQGNKRKKSFSTDAMAFNFEDEESSKKKKRERKEYSADDMDLINTHLDSYINSDGAIIREEFEKYVRSKAELKDLINEFGITRLIVKMRTERKYRR